MTVSHFLALLACGCVSLSSASIAAPQCHSNDRYHVVAEPLPDDVGNRFAVTRLARTVSTDCVFNEAAADLVIGKEGDPLWYADLVGDSLILSRSTGPQGDLVVYDLKSGRSVLDVPADEYELKGDVLSFWERTSRATPATCPTFAENEANGLGSVTAVLKRLDLHSKLVSDGGTSKCVAVQ